MDALTSILLYACAAVAVAGALVAAIAPPRLRQAGLLAVAVGTAAVLAVLSAGLAAIVFLVCGVAVVGLLASVVSPLPDPPRFGGREVVALGVAVLYLGLAYAAFKGSFALAGYPGGVVNSAAVARLLLDHDALAGVAAGGLLLVGIAGAAASWRGARR